MFRYSFEKQKIEMIKTSHFMRSILMALIFIPVFAYGQSTDINWISLNDAEKRMEKEPRKVLIDVYTDWCGPCKIMNNTTFKDPAVVEYVNRHFYAVKFNAEGPDPLEFRGHTFKNESYDPNRRGRNGTHDLTRAIAPVNGRIAYPTIVYMDEDFNLLTPVQGLQRPEQILPILSFFAEDAYKTQTWEEYQKSR